MLIEDISASQITTAVLFLTILIALQFYIFKNKNRLKEKWASNKRIRLSDSTRLGPTERVQIIKVDNTEFLYFFSKGCQPVIIPMAFGEGFPTKTSGSLKANQPQSGKSHRSKENLKIKPDEKNSAKSDHKLIQAISRARKQNPKISFE